MLLKILERVKRIVGEGGYKENHRERKKILETVSVDESKVIIELQVFCGYGGKMCIWVIIHSVQQDIHWALSIWRNASQVYQS